MKSLPRLDGLKKHPETNSHAVRTLAALMPVILLQQVIGALGFPITKYGVTEIEPFTFAFFRFVIASLLMFAIVLVRKEETSIERKDWPKIIGLGILMVLLNQLGYLWGQSMTGAGHGSILYATTPIWVFLFAHFHLGEKMFWRRGLGIGIAVAGVLVIMSGGVLHIGMEYLVGDIIIFIAVLAWAYYTILGKPLAQKYGALRMTAYALISGSLLYFPFGVYRAVEFDYSSVTTMGWLAVLYMAIAMSIIAYVAWYWVLKQMDASRLAVFSNIQPVIATIAAYFMIGETVGLSFLIGAGVVLAGVITAEV
ncbi:MAG: DMT family transporter [candidate division Zixibacteria bacterium]|nr:DMT family transporter [candidate division Zixibacteria bacterium]